MRERGAWSYPRGSANLDLAPKPQVTGQVGTFFFFNLKAPGSRRVCPRTHLSPDLTPRHSPDLQQSSCDRRGFVSFLQMPSPCFPSCLRQVPGLRCDSPPLLALLSLEGPLGSIHREHFLQEQLLSLRDLHSSTCAPAAPTPRQLSAPNKQAKPRGTSSAATLLEVTGERGSGQPHRPAAGPPSPTPTYTGTWAPDGGWSMWMALEARRPPK